MHLWFVLGVVFMSQGRPDHSMQDSQHISSAFAQDLSDLRMDLVRLSMLATRQLSASLRAMSDFQSGQIDQLIQQDAELDKLQELIDEKVISIITMRPPRADDLRLVITAARIASDLERIGDYARNIAKRTSAVMNDNAEINLPWDRLIEIGTLVTGMIDDVVDAYQQGDIDAAQAIRNSDIHVDKLNTSFIQETIDLMESNKLSAIVGTHLIFMSKNLERIGDYTTSIAEQVHFIVTGEALGGTRPKADKSSQIS